MTNIVNEEENKKTERDLEKKQKGLFALAIVGIGFGLYGYNVGRTKGYAQGVKDGIVYMSNEFIEATGNIAKATKDLKGE
jgi:hypothetical protein